MSDVIVLPPDTMGVFSIGASASWPHVFSSLHPVVLPPSLLFLVVAAALHRLRSVKQKVQEHKLTDKTDKLIARPGVACNMGGELETGGRRSAPKCIAAISL